MGKWSVEVKDNGFNSFSDHCRKFGKDLVEETALDIESEVSAEWGWTRLPIYTRGPTGNRTITAMVIAGKRGRYYAPFLEWGTIDQAPHPAMTQAAEFHRQTFIVKAMSLSVGWRR